MAVLALAACSAIPSAARVKEPSVAVASASPSVGASTPGGPAGGAAVNGAGMPLAPASYYEQELTWKDCAQAGEAFECATLKVPLNYASPSRSIGLSVLKRPADDVSDKLGALVINPGGPGGSGVDYAKYATTVFSPGVTARYDIVGFDPRGVGRSAPIRCIDNRQTDTWLSMDATPDTPAEIADLVAFDKTFAQACKKNTGAVLGHVSTVEAAADMDLLRAALGEKKLSFFGASYGTLLGATYAQEFPDRVGRFVLDGAVSPTATADEASKSQAAGFETALTAFIADCVKDTCALGRSAAAAKAKLASFIDSLDKDPLPTGTSRVLTQQLGETGVVAALYSRDDWVILRLALIQAFDGNGGGLLALADGYSGRVNGTYDSSLLQANVAIDCLDSGKAGSSVADVEKQAAAYEAVAPIFGDSTRWSALACHDWPVTAEFPTPKLTAVGAAPIVVVGTTRDPATPYAWSEELASTLTSGVLLTRDGDGHTGYRQGNACIDTTVDAYLLAGTVPKDGKRCD
jgi:pimeloyl-ACP methyl ester carboxylesterase